MYVTVLYIPQTKTERTTYTIALGIFVCSKFEFGLSKLISITRDDTETSGEFYFQVPGSVLGLFTNHSRLTFSKCNLG